MKEEKNKRRIVYLLILAVFCVLLVIVNYSWISKDKSPPYCSHLVYLIMSREYFEILLRGEFFDFLVNAGNFYPPLPFQVTAIFYAIFGYGGVQAVMSQGIFWIILIFSTFLLGSYLWNDDVGFASALVAAVIPQDVYFMRTAGVDIPITAMVPLCLYCLFRSERFKNRKWTILFFISLATGMLLKWVFIIFIFLPALIYFLWMVRDRFNDKNTRTEIIIFIIAVIFFAAIYYLSLLYVHNLSNQVDMVSLIENYYIIFTCFIVVAFVALSFALKNRSKEVLNTSQGLLIFLCLTAHFTVVHLIPMRDIYKIWFWDVQYNLLLPVRTAYHFFIKFWIYANFGLPYFILFVTGISIYCFSGEKTFEKSILPLSAVFAMIFLYTQPVYDSRYFMPLNSIAAMFMVFWVFNIKKWVLRIPIFLLMGILALYYIGGGVFLPNSPLAMEERLGRVTMKPYVSVNGLDEASSYILNLYRSDAPAKSMLIVVDDGCSDITITPLLILYHLRKDRNPDEMVALLYRGADPIFAEKREPWGFFIGKKEKEKDDDEKKDRFYSKDVEKEMRQKRGRGEDLNPLDRLESSEIRNVDSGTVYFCRFRDHSSPEKFPVELFKALKDKFSENDISKSPLHSVRVLDGTMMDVYKVR